MAGLNLVVLSEGIYCFYVLLNEQPSGRLSISLFYGAALSCLSVAMFYFLTGYLTMDPCPLYFLETAPGVLYLVTGLIYIANYSQKIFTVETQLLESFDMEQKIKKRRNSVIIFLIIIGVGFLTAYTVDTGIACTDKGTSYKSDQWDGALTIIFYLFTFLILLYQAKHEWNFMNR